jgi:hypothetical protein
MITLLDGRQMTDDNFALDERNYHITLESTGEDVTNLVTRADKIALFPGFDIERESYRLSTEKPASGGGRTATERDLEPLDESTASIFVGQILHDPLAAPIQTLDATVDQVFASTGVRKILVVAALIVAAAIYFKNK